MSSIVGGEFLLGNLEKEVLIRQLEALSEFCGIEVLSYCIMSNHYHLLIRVPKDVKLTDLELHQRVVNYYGKGSKEAYRLNQMLAEEGEIPSLWREKYLSMMGDLSVFQKLYKQRFSVWYNKRVGRRGTLWMERFKSLLIEDSFLARLALSSYIHLNPLRAGLVKDPAAYRYSSYGRAMVGNERARAGLVSATGEDNWKEAQGVYREFILVRGMLDQKQNERVISEELLAEARKRHGSISMSQLIRLRIRYFSDGLVLGGEEFVERVYHQYRDRFGEKRRKGSRRMQGGAWGELRVIRDLRKEVIG